MAYIVFHTTAFLNEDDTSSMTAAALKAAGITSVKGYGGIDVPVNSEGYLKNPAQHLPDGMLDKLKGAWTSSNGDANAFFNQNIDGTPVKDILAQCPSQQSYGIAKELGLPDGTAVPCKEFTDHGYQHIKYDSGSSVPPSSGTDAAGAAAADSVAAAGAGAGAAAGAADSGSAGAGAGDWWAFFGSKEFLIGAVAVAGVIALIKALGNTIKARFRKCAKVLYRMQKDFGTKQNGMDMKAVLPGVGSKIMDWVGSLWGSKAGKGKNKGALGLRPFVDNYRNELSADYQEARKAFNMIAAAGKGINDKNKGKEQTNGKMNNLQSESQTVIYSSFSELLKSEPLNEEETALNEGAGAIVALGAVKFAAGMYQYLKKDKNGNDVGSAKAVQVTHQSTREICYSILNMFFSKYFNMKAVSEKMGMNVDSLGDIDKSNVDKFAKLAQAMKQEQASGKGSKIYARVEKNYNQMVDAYVRIANSVVNNFEKYTKNSKGKDGKVKELSEKDSNLLVASVEKLRAEVNRQEDGYRNNFFRVVNAIITSPEYTTYLDFIIKDVIPVFKTGLASDADFVLDVVPKAGEYYILQQTNQQTDLAGGDTAKGNVVLARVLGFDQSGEKSKNPVINFARVALLKDPGTLVLNNNKYDMSSYKEENLDRTAFGQARGENADKSENGDNVELTYNKWMALNPVLAVNVPGDTHEKTPAAAKVYKRTAPNENGQEKQEQEQYIIINPTSSESITYNESEILYEDDKKTPEENNTTTDTNNTTNTQQEETKSSSPVKNVIFVSGNTKTNIEIQANDATQEKVNAIVTNRDNNMGFTEVSPEEAEQIINAVANAKEETVQVQTAENLPEIINKQESANGGESEIGADVIIKNIDNISNSIAQQLGTLKIEDFTVTSGTAGRVTSKYNNGTIQLKNTAENQRQRNFDSVVTFDTGATTKAGKKIYIAAQPRTDNKNITVDLILVSGDGTNYDEIKFRGAQKDAYVSLTAPINAQNVKQGIETIVNYYKQYAGKYTIEESNITVEYDKYFNVAESFMSSFGFNGANKLHVNRTIKAPKSKFTYYALSENAWGDGSKLDPEKYIKESLDAILAKNSTYDEFAKLAKNSNSINLIKIAEDCSYNTALPYNRYQMLTAANPLYEGLVVVRFDERGKLVEAIRLGVKKIYCETV